MEKGNCADVTSLLLLNDFNDFQDHSSVKFNRSSESSSSSHLSVDTDVRDTLYAQLYFKDSTHLQRDSSFGSSEFNTSDSDIDLVIIEDSREEDVIIIVDSSPSVSKPPPTESTKSSVSSVGKRKRKRKRNKPVKKRLKNEDSRMKARKESNSSSMELDSDSEIIVDNVITTTTTTTSDRQAALQARLPDKIDPSNKWFLVEKDLLGRDQYERLYEFKRYNLMQLKCPNCKQKGHNRSDCPQSKRHTVCYLCGIVDHVSSRCPQYICQYCFQPSHRGKQCNSSISNPRGHCMRCYMKGHTEKLCPEQWRQFHNTTNKSTHLYKLDAHQRNNDNVYCCQCSNSGHYGFECTQYRPRGCPLPFSSLIAHYDNDAFRYKRKRHENRDRDDHHHRQSRSKTHESGYHRSERYEESFSRHEPKRSKLDYLPPQKRHSLPITPVLPLPSPIQQAAPRQSLSSPQYTSSTPTPLFPQHHISVHERLDPLPHEIRPSPPVRSLSFVHNRLPDDIFQSPPPPPRWDLKRQEKYRESHASPSFPDQRHSSFSSLSGEYHDQRYDQEQRRRSDDWSGPPPKRRWSMDDHTTRRYRH